MTAASPYTDNPKRTFSKGNPGKPKGALSRTTIAQIEVAQFCAGKAFDKVKALIDCDDKRISLRACEVVLSYAWGLPRQTVDVLDLRASQETRRLAERYEPDEAKRAEFEDRIREELAAMGRELAEAHAKATSVDAVELTSDNASEGEKS